MKSRSRLRHGPTRWSLLNGIYYAGYKPQCAQRGQYGAVKIGLESSLPLGRGRLGGDALYLNWHLTCDWFFDNLNFHVSEDEVRSFPDQ